MKNLFYLIPLLVFASCLSDEQIPYENNPSNLTGYWQMSKVALFDKDFTDDCNTQSILIIDSDLTLQETEYGMYLNTITGSEKCKKNPRGILPHQKILKDESGNYYYNDNKFRIYITFESNNSIKRSFRKIEANGDLEEISRYDIWNRIENIDPLVGDWKKTKHVTANVDFTNNCNTKSTLSINHKLNLQETEYSLYLNTTTGNEKCVKNQHGELDDQTVLKDNEGSYYYDLDNEFRVYITFESNNSFKRTFRKIEANGNIEESVFVYEIWERQ